MPVSAPLSSRTERTVRLCKRVRRAMSSASSSIATPAFTRRTFDWLRTSLSKGMSRDSLKVILGCDLAMGGSPVVRGGRAGSLSPDLIGSVTKLLVPPLPLGLAPVGRGVARPEAAATRPAVGPRAGIVAVLLACGSCLTVAEGQQIIGRLGCRRCRAHDCPVLLGQEVYPGANVIGMPHGRDDAESRTYVC